MKKLVLAIAVAGCAAIAAADPDQQRNDSSQILHKKDYRVPMEEVIVIGQEPYWRRHGKPRWDRGKVDVDLKPETRSRLQMFPNYTAEERDEAMKLHDSNRNNASPKIKLFDVKF